MKQLQGIQSTYSGKGKHLNEKLNDFITPLPLQLKIYTQDAYSQAIIGPNEMKTIKGLAIAMNYWYIRIEIEYCSMKSGNGSLD